jgi:acyl-CoA thioesterase-1
VLELGANDFLGGFDIAQTEKNLKAIVEKVKAKHPTIPIIIAGMQSPPNMGKEYEQKFNSLFKDLAKEYNAGLIPFLLEDVAGISELNLPDGKHPNEEGQKIVAENVWKELVKYL